MEGFSFSDFDQFAEAIRDVDCRYTLMGHGETPWSVRVLTAGRVALQVAQEGGPNIYEGATREEVFIAFLPLGEPDRVSFFGRELQHSSLVALPPGRSSIAVAKTANRWASLHVPVALLGGNGRFE